MDHIGIEERKPDLHPRREGRSDRAAPPDRARALRRGARPPAPRPGPDRGLDRERRGGPLSRGSRPRGHRRRPQLRPHVCDPLPQGQDEPARCPHLGRGMSRSRPRVARSRQLRARRARSPWRCRCSSFSWWRSSRSDRAPSPRSSRPCRWTAPLAMWVVFSARGGDQRQTAEFALSMSSAPRPTDASAPYPGCRCLSGGPPPIPERGGSEVSA
jgi:hypothetical protein